MIDQTVYLYIGIIESEQDIYQPGLTIEITKYSTWEIN